MPPLNVGLRLCSVGVAASAVVLLLLLVPGCLRVQQVMYVVDFMVYEHVM